MRKRLIQHICNVQIAGDKRQKEKKRERKNTVEQGQGITDLWKEVTL